MIPVLWRNAIHDGAESPPSTRKTEASLTLGPQHDLSAFAGDHDGSFALHAIRYSRKRHEFVATDGYILAAVPAGIDDAPLDESVMIPASVIREASNGAKDRGGRFSATMKVGGGGVLIETDDGLHACRQVDGRFPCCSSILDDVNATLPLASVRVDARLLAKICEHAARSYSNPNATPSIEVSILPPTANDNNAPVVIRLGSPFGSVEATYLLMPLERGDR